jgi:hypothetical protein
VFRTKPGLTPVKSSSYNHAIQATPLPDLERGLELERSCDVRLTERPYHFVWGGNTMRNCSIVCLVLVAGLALSLPAHAEYLLNCRLMDPHTPDFIRWCLGEREQRRYLVEHCDIQGSCMKRLQNFSTVFSRNVAADKEGPVTSYGGDVVGGSSLSSVTNGTISGASTSVQGVAREAGDLVGRTLSTVGF